MARIITSSFALSLLLGLTGFAQAEVVQTPPVSAGEEIATPPAQLSAPIRYIPKAEREANRKARLAHEKKAACPGGKSGKGESMTVCTPQLPAAEGDLSQTKVPQSQRALPPVSPTIDVNATSIR